MKFCHLLCLLLIALAAASYPQQKPGDVPPSFKLDAETKDSLRAEAAGDGDRILDRDSGRYWDTDRKRLGFENEITRFGDITLAEKQRAGEIVAIGGDVTVPESARTRNLVVIWGSATVQGVVDGELVVIGGTINLGPKALVRGELVDIGSGITRDADSSVAGSIVEIPMPGLGAGSLMGLLLFFALFGIFAALLALPLKLMVFAIVPDRIQTAAKSFGVRNGQSGLVGVLALALLPVFIMITAFMADAFPLLGVLMVGFLISLVVSGELFGATTLDFIIGNRILRGRGYERPFLAVFLGSLVFAVLVSIPIIGWWIIRSIGYCLAFGLSMVTVFGSKAESGGPVSPGFYGAASHPVTQSALASPQAPPRSGVGEENE